MDNIKLGVTARDKVTGFTGVVTSRVDFLSGNVQFSLQPKGADGNLPDAHYFDFHMLEFVDEGVSANVMLPAQTSIKVGNKVRDKASLFTGTATGKTTFMNGCVYFTVVPEMRTTALINEVPAGSFLEHTRLEVVGDGLIEPEEKPKKRITGGPTSRVQRIAAHRG